MRKYILTLIFGATLFAIAACGGETEQEQYVAEEPTADEEIQNPFVVPLMEYLAEGVEVEFGGFELGTRNTISFLVDIDGEGNEGVFAARFDEDSYGFPSPVGRVFYVVNGELLYMDIENHVSLEVLVTTNNRLVQSVGMGRYEWSYTLFGLVNGRLAPTQTLFVIVDALNMDAEPNYYLYNGGWQSGIENATPISQEEFTEITTRYALNGDFNSPWGMADETDYILSF